MATYLVTGCAGFIGSHLTERLLTEKHSVVGVDGFTDTYDRRSKEANLCKALDSPAFRFVEMDLAFDDLTETLAAVDGIFHLAARAGVRTSWGADFGSYLNDNLLATQRLFELSAGRRVVFASSSSVYGNAMSYPTPESSETIPLNPYGVTKLACESLARAYSISKGLDFVALRYFTVYGPRQRPDMAFTRIARALLGTEPFIVFGDGRQRRDFTYVSDAVTATISAMTGAPSGATYNVGGGEEADLNDVIHLFEAYSDARLRRVAAPPSPGDAYRTAANTTAIRRDLDWNPETSLKDGIRAHFDWAKSSTFRR